MKKLFLLIGVVVFLTPMVVNADSSLPKCEIKKNEVITQEACYGKIIDSSGDKFVMDYDTFFQKQILEQIEEFDEIDYVKDVVQSYKDYKESEEVTV